MLLKLRDGGAVPQADKAGALNLCPPGWKGSGNVTLVYSTFEGEGEAWEKLLLTFLIGRVGRDLVIKISCGLPN